MKYFIALFMYVAPMNFAHYTHGTSKHYGACLTPRMSKRKR